LNRSLKFLLVFIITLSGVAGHPVVAPGARPGADVSYGPQTIPVLTRRLQKNRFDFVSWHRLGVAYYQNGYPARAIKPLLYSAGKIRESSLNSLYLGLAYEATGEATGKYAQARYWLAQAAAYPDEPGSKALFELASLEYRTRNVERAISFLKSYIQRFPAGGYRAQADKLLAAATAGKFNDPATGIDKPDMERLYYRNSRRALFDYPHFWFLQTGFMLLTSEYSDPTGKEDGPPLKPGSDSEYGITANAGVGIGPWREGTRTASGGYLYRQTYYTTDSRVEQFMNDPGNLRYFPFRFDLLKRRHTLFGDFRGKLTEKFDAGVFGRHEIAKIGSEFFSGEEEGDLRSSLNISDTTTLIPWVGTSFVEKSRTTGYMYLRKEVNYETPDLSNKTYDLLGGSATPAFSIGASHSQLMMNDQLTLSGEVFNYDFIFNDYWVDFSRFGGFVEADYRINQSFALNGIAGFYQDHYSLGRPRMNGNCNTDSVQRATNTSDPVPAPTPAPTPALCQRDDSGTVVQGGLRWNLQDDTQLSTSVLYVNNGNQTMREYDFTQVKFQIAVTRAFPNVQRVERMSERFADYVFFKEAR
jgi:hypothetical protein